MAALMVVLFHVLDTTNQDYVVLNAQVLHLQESFRFLRMPLFAVIAGYVFGLRPVRLPQLGKFFRGKGRRIGIPFLVATTLHLVCWVFLGKGETPPLSDVLMQYIAPSSYYWFCASILLLLSLAALGDVSGILASRTWRLALLALSVIPLSFGVFSETPLLGLQGAVRLLPFFLVGIEISRSSLRDKPWPIWLVLSCVIAVVVGIATQQLSSFQSGKELGPGHWTMILAGLGGTALLFSKGFHIPILAKVGVYSFTVYLYHFFTFRIVLRLTSAVGLELPSPVLVLLAFASGIVVPILLHEVASRICFVSEAVLGLRYRTSAGSGDRAKVSAFPYSV